MQQLVQNNRGASLGALETALSDHTDAEDKAPSGVSLELLTARGLPSGGFGRPGAVKRP
jgi:hypothetical protein